MTSCHSSMYTAIVNARVSPEEAGGMRAVNRLLISKNKTVLQLRAARLLLLSINSSALLLLGHLHKSPLSPSLQLCQSLLNIPPQIPIWLLGRNISQQVL